jgi:hypothetical protein
VQIKRRKEMSVSTVFYRRAFVLTTLTVLLISVYAPIVRFGVFADAGWLTGWSHRRQLTVNGGLISEALTDFPLVVKLDSSFFDFNSAKTNGEDVRFTSSDGTTLLKYEIERWNKTAGKAELWVKLPSISSGGNTTFYIYYGNAGASDAQDPTNVWDSNFMMVQHLEEPSGTVTDSTSHGNSGNYSGAARDVEGKIDGADGFDGVNDYVFIPHSNSLNFGTGPFTISLWVKFANNPSSDYDILRKGCTTNSPPSPSNYKMEVLSNKLSANLHQDSVGDVVVTSAGSYGDDNWHFMVCQREAQTMRLYVDTSLIGSVGSASQDLTNGANMSIGSKDTLDDDFYAGLIDEVEISNTNRSLSWINTSYYSVNNTLVTYGPEEPLGPIALTLTVTSPQNKTYYQTTVALQGSTNLNANITYSLDGQTAVSVANNTNSFLTSLTGLTIGSHSVTAYAVESVNVSNTASSTLGFSVQNAPSWADPDCKYRVKLTFKNSASSENLTDFPILVVLNSSRIDYGKTSATDIRFYDGATLLKKDTDLWNSSGNSYVWVRVPQIDNSNTDYIYAYYNCIGSSNLDDAAGVWSGYAMVQHLEETSGTVLTDSTSNHNDGTPSSVVLNVSGQIDGGDDYDGTSSYSAVNDSSTLNFGTNSFSYMYWFKSRATVTQDVVDKKGGTADATNAGYKLTISSAAATGFSAALADGTTNVRLNTGTDPSRGGNVWTLFTVVVDRAQQKMFVYINGVAKANAAINTVGSVTNTKQLYLGKDVTGLGRNYNGSLDEVRIFNGSRSASWTYAEYLSMSDQYITFGSQETADTYTLTVSTVGQGTVNLNSTGPYYYGEVVQLTAVPTIGWSFNHWNGDLSGSVNPATLAITGNMSVTATFTQDVYTLTINLVGNGVVNLNSSGPYHYGDTIQLTAVPAMGWSFSAWGGHLSGPANPTTIIMNGNKTVTATFTQNTYTLSVTISGSGTVILNNTGPYHYGDTVQLTANPTIGWSFDHWSGDLLGSTNPTTILINGNKSVTATFTQNTYTLSVSVDPVGSGSVSLNNTGPYHYGDVVQLIALPASGWSFSIWSGDLVDSSNPATMSMTGNKTVTAHFTGAGTRLYVDPYLTEKRASDIGTTFDINVTVQSVNDLWGFDINVTWDKTLLTLVGVDFTTTLDRVWGPGNWIFAKNESGPGYYKLVALSTSNSFNSTTATTLATLRFRVEDPHTGLIIETAIHFDTHKLSDSKWTPITHTAEDGLYRITGAKPILTLNPTTKTCRTYGETFTVKINVANAGGADDFRFEIHYNATLLDVAGITWNAWGSGNYTADEVNGILTGYTSGSPLSANVTLLTITFNATFYHLWKDESTIPTWKNIQTGTIYVQWANLSYPTSPDLGYVRGGLDQISVGPDFAYTFSPIQGDVDNNGVVDVFDIRTIAAYYDTVNPQYNLTGDSTIDIFDIVVVAANFGYTYTP